jgi:hypothetical protein
VVSFTLYTQGKSPCYPLNRRLVGPQSQSRHSDEEKNSQPLLGLEPRIIQPIAQHYTTEQSWLHFMEAQNKKKNNMTLFLIYFKPIFM